MLSFVNLKQTHLKISTINVLIIGKDKISSIVSCCPVQSSEIIARKENYSEVEHQTALFSYFNQAQAMQLFAPQLFAPQSLMPSWPFHPTFFSGWPLSTPLPYTSPPSEFNSQEPMSNSYEQQSIYSRSVSPASPFNESKLLVERKESSKTKIFQCKVCSKTFGYKHVLQNHEKVHTGEKNYRCLKCNKCFRRDHHLKVHMRLHSGEKPYVCSFPLCDRQFVQVANLRRHLKTHEHASNLKIHEKLLTTNDERCSRRPYKSESSEDSMNLKVNKDEFDLAPLDMSFKVTRYDSPEQNEPEDLSVKSSS